MKLLVKQNTTSKTVTVFIQNNTSTTGAGLTGLAFNTAGLTAYYYREADASTTAITLVTATLGTWASGGFIVVDATNMSGVYQIGLPNACFTALGSVVVYLQGASNMAPLVLEIQVVAYDPNNANLGITNVSANVVQWSGSNVPAPNIAGEPKVDLVAINGNAASVSSTVPATVNGYTVGEDPATLILGATASSWNTAGTIGQKINSAGGSADPLTNSVPGSYAAGTAGYVLGTYLNASVAAVKTQTDKLLFDASNFVKSDPQTAVTVVGTVSANTVQWGGAAVGGMPYSGTPPTTAQIATAVMSDVTDTVGADVVAVKAKTDLIATNSADSPNTVAAQGTISANLDAKISTRSAPATAQTIDLTTSVPTSNTAQTLGDCLNAARAQGFGKWVITGTTLNLYAADGTTIVRAFTLDSATAPTQRV